MTQRIEPRSLRSRQQCLNHWATGLTMGEESPNSTVILVFMCIDTTLDTNTSRGIRMATISFLALIFKTQILYKVQRHLGMYL